MTATVDSTGTVVSPTPQTMNDGPEGNALDAAMMMQAMQDPKASGSQNEDINTEAGNKAAPQSNSGARQTKSLEPIEEETEEAVQAEEEGDGADLADTSAASGGESAGSASTGEASAGSSAPELTPVFEPVEGEGGRNYDTLVESVTQPEAPEGYAYAEVEGSLDEDDGTKLWQLNRVSTPSAGVGSAATDGPVEYEPGQWAEPVSEPVEDPLDAGQFYEPTVTGQNIQPEAPEGYVYLAQEGSGGSADETTWQLHRVVPEPSLPEIPVGGAINGDGVPVGPVVETPAGNYGRQVHATLSKGGVDYEPTVLGGETPPEAPEGYFYAVTGTEGDQVVWTLHESSNAAVPAPVEDPPGTRPTPPDLPEVPEGGAINSDGVPVGPYEDTSGGTTGTGRQVHGDLSVEGLNYPSTVVGGESPPNAPEGYFYQATGSQGSDTVWQLFEAGPPVAIPFGTTPQDPPGEAPEAPASDPLGPPTNGQPVEVETVPIPGGGQGVPQDAPVGEHPHFIPGEGEGPGGSEAPEAPEGYTYVVEELPPGSVAEVGGVAQEVSWGWRLVRGVVAIGEADLGLGASLVVGTQESQDEQMLDWIHEHPYGGPAT